MTAWQKKDSLETHVENERRRLEQLRAVLEALPDARVLPLPDGREAVFSDRVQADCVDFVADKKGGVRVVAFAVVAGARAYHGVQAAEWGSFTYASGSALELRAETIADLVSWARRAR